MMRTLSAILLIAAIVSAIPTNDVTPEDTLVEYDADSRRNDYEYARKHIQTLMETGKNDKECRDLATASKKAIEDDVKADQKILDALPDGSDCKKEGQPLVSSSMNSLTQAKSDKDGAKKKLDKAKATNVDFGSIPYNQLTPGQCGTFFNHASYKNAKSALDKAQKAYDKADGAHKAAQTAYDQAVAAASSAKLECLCRAKKAFDHGWKEVKKTTPNAGVGWKTAHDIICVLDGTPVSKCKVPAQPTVKKPTLDPEAAKMNSATCNGGKVALVAASCGVVSDAGTKFTSNVMQACGTHTNQMVPLGSCVTWRYWNGKVPYGGNTPAFGLVSFQYDTHLTATQVKGQFGNGLSASNADFGMALNPAGALQVFTGAGYATAQLTGTSGTSSPDQPNGGLYRICLAKDGTVTYSFKQYVPYAWKKDVHTAQKKATGPMFVDVLTWQKSRIFDFEVSNKPSWK
jgi:hypothetical protein